MKDARVRISLRSQLPVMEILQTAAQALRRNLTRATLTSLSMVVGTASLVLVVVAGISGRDYTLDQIRGIGSNLISVYHEAADATMGTNALADRLNDADVKAIRTQVPGVHNAAPLVLSFPAVTLEGISHVVSLIGTTPEYEVVRNIRVLDGRFLDENDERYRDKVCLVTDLFAKKLRRDPFYKGFVDFYGLQFRVVGTFRERVSTFGQSEVGDYSALIPISVIRYFKPREAVDQIYVSADTMELVPQVTSDIRRLLLNRHRQQALYKVDNLTEILNAADKISLGLTVVLLVIAAISLLASGIGIMNVMLITVAERTREIGIKRAVGAFRHVLLVEVLTEALMLAFAGGSIGILTGVAVPYSVHFFAPDIRIRIPPLAIMSGFAAIFAVGVIFGSVPAMRAARLSPADALRTE